MKNLFKRLFNKQSHKDDSFINQYLLPEPLRKQAELILNNPTIVNAIIYRNTKKLRQAGFTLHKTFCGNIIAEHPQLPGWVIKGPRPPFIRHLGIFKNISRINGAEELRNIIKQLNVEDKIIIPKKYLFHFSHHNKKLSDNNYCVISQKIPIADTPLTCIAPKDLETLLQVITLSKFFDPRINNFCLTQDGAIAIIDTEKFSMNPALNGAARYFFSLLYRLANVHIKQLAKQSKPS